MLNNLKGNSRNHRRKLSRAQRWNKCLALFGVALFSGLANKGFCADNTDPVLDLLLQKGMITESEAAKVKASLDSRRTNEAPKMPDSVWKIGPGIKNIELYGDIRLRFESREVTDPTGGRIELDRLRYALRFGLRGEAYDDFNYGFRLDTAANPRSPWVTMGTSASGTPYQGPFGKSNAGLNVGQLYLGYKAGEWGSVTVGKMPQPLYTTSMVWDTDFNPEGLAEHLTYNVGAADFFANFGQFLYQDTNPLNTSQGYFGLGNLYPSTKGSSADLVFMLAWQLGVTYHFDKDISAKIAPVLYNYTGHGVNTSQSASLVEPGFGGVFVGQGANVGAGGVPASGYSGFPGGYQDGFSANQTGINDLMVLEIPWEVNFKIAQLNARVFGDFAKNFSGAARARAAAAASLAPPGPPVVGGVAPISVAQTSDDKAYQVGFAIGNKNSLGEVYGSKAIKHAWEFRTFWQHIEQYALDPNLIDSDFFEGRGNLEGIYAAFSYGFTDNVLGTIRYGYAQRINSLLGTGGSNQDIPQMNPIQKYQIVQFDMTLRF